MPRSVRSIFIPGGEWQERAWSPVLGSCHLRAAVSWEGTHCPFIYDKLINLFKFHSCSKAHLKPSCKPAFANLAGATGCCWPSAFPPPRPASGQVGGACWESTTGLNEARGFQCQVDAVSGGDEQRQAGTGELHCAQGSRPSIAVAQQANGLDTARSLQQKPEM